MTTITGTSGDDTLTGTSGADTLIGLGGNDILIGAAGVDTTDGGLGDDWHFVDNAGDVVVEAAGEGNDRIFASVSYTLAAGVSVELMSTDFNAGTAAINLTGNELANIIFGNAGDNILSGGAGADTLLGGAGNDWYFIDNAGDAVFDGIGQGNDRVFASVSYALTAGAEVEVMSTDFNAGTAAINLTGNELANFIIGNDGANSLNGGDGADVLVGRLGNDILTGGIGADVTDGGAGDDWHFVDNAGDQVVEAAGEGNDRVFAGVSYALAAGASVELLTTDFNAGTAAINLTGNEFANTIYGNDGDNILTGGAGADTLVGRLGNDWFFVDDAGDQVLENAGEGNDRVFASVNYTLAAGVSVEMLTTDLNVGTSAINLTGNELANTIFGNDGANSLDGGTGADALFGRAGDDFYFVDNAGDAVFENAGEGNDRIFTSVSYALGAGLSVETLSTSLNVGTSAINLTGNELANTIFGNDGANILDGGAGADTLVGRAGNDFFAFTTTLGAGNIDAIVDFVAGSDKIQLGGAAGQPFLALATGTLRAGTLVTGSTALDADDYLIYNSATGALLYDADGAGGAAAVQFATLSTGLSLTVADFTVSGAPNVAPAITSGATASVAENSSASTIVYQTAASDADGDRITYSLSGTDAGLLSIDANGAVRLNAPADFETKASYSFNVIASDSGTATAKAVTLTITDVNESASTPIINETQAANDTQGTAQSIDPNTLVIANNPNLVNQALPSASIIGSISAPGDTTVSTDVDFYSITLQAGQQLILDVDGTSGLDAFVSIFGPNGAFIISNDDPGSFDPGSVETGYGHNVDSQIIFRAPSSGTYYFSIKSFVDEDTNLPDSKGSYTLHVSVNTTPATPQQLLAEDVDALISGSSWAHAGPAFNLTFGFPSLASQYPQNFAEVASQGPNDPAPVFEAFNATQQAATRSLLQLIANVTQITFSENVAQGNFNVAGTAANAILRYAESSEALPTAYAYYPGSGQPTDRGGSAWFGHETSGPSDFDTPQRGNYAWMGILHETGHALGLKHGHETPLAISVDHDSIEYSVMTYRSFPGQSLENGGGYTNEQWGFAQTLMMLDIAALQKIYGGANYNFNSGNSVYTWSATTGEMSINGVGQGAPGDGNGVTLPSENRILMTIWDGGGNDTYDLSNYTGSNSIDLRPGEWSVTSSGQLANLGQGHMARGNVANALLFEGNTGSLIENAIGGSGGNVIIANQAVNHLTGNGGSDTFRWTSTTDSAVGQADTVMDFNSNQVDLIDLTTIDANTTIAGNQNFTFIGTNAFHNVAGEVRFEVIGGNANIFADVDGNGVADMQIILNNVTFLGGADFNL